MSKWLTLWPTACMSSRAVPRMCDMIDRAISMLAQGAAPMPWAYDLDQIPLDLDDPFDNDSVQRALARDGAIWAPDPACVLEDHEIGVAEAGLRAARI